MSAAPKHLDFSAPPIVRTIGQRALIVGVAFAIGSIALAFLRPEEFYRGYLLGYMDCEATPTLPPVPGVDLQEYKYTLIERFSNPQVRDTITRLCAESSDRIPKWLLPVVRE